MSDSIKITISLSKESFEKLKEQVEMLKSAPLPDMGTIDSVEDLIEKYIEQLVTPNKQMQEMQMRAESIWKAFSEKGIDMKEIFENLADEMLEKQKPKKKKKVEEEKAKPATPTPKEKKN